MPVSARVSGGIEEELTAWGRWVKTQPKGVLSRAMRSTGLAWTTVSRAQTKLVSRDVAELLSKFSRGKVRVREIVKQRVPPERLSA